MWSRILDDEILELARNEVRFRFSAGEYSLVWDPGTQHSLKVVYGGDGEVWHLFLRERSGGDVKLSGMADWVPEILGEACWFEFVISDEPTVTYWGDRVIYRQDVAADRFP